MLDMAATRDEPRCTSCRHWWPVPGEVWHPAGEDVGDCLLHQFETAAGENCRAHDPQQASAFRRTP